jgi:hypothetical protein
MKEGEQKMTKEQQQIAEFIAVKGVTKCPPAAVKGNKIRIELSKEEKNILRRHQEKQELLMNLKNKLYKEGPYFL